MTASKNKGMKVGNEGSKYNRQRLQKADSYIMAPSRQHHCILLKHKFTATNKEAILWSTCFNVPPRQINNTNLKVRNGIFDEPHGGKMIAYSVG